MKQFAAKGSTRICEILVLKKNGLPNGAKLLNTDVSTPVTFSRCHARHTELNVIFSFCIFLKAKEIVFSGMNSPPALFADLFLQILALTYVFFLTGFMRNVSEPRRKSTYFSRLRWNSLFAVGRTCFTRIKNKQFRMARLNETGKRSSWLLLEQHRNAIFLKELLPILLDF